MLPSLCDLIDAFANASVSTAERGLALRRAARQARAMGLVAEIVDGTLFVNGQPARRAADAGATLERAMRAHRLRRVEVRQHAPARDIAQLAGYLTRPTSGDTPSARDSLDAMRLWGVRVSHEIEATPSDADAATERFATAVDDERARLASCTDADSAANAARGLAQALTRVTEESSDAPARAARYVATAYASMLDAAPPIAREALAQQTLVPAVVNALGIALVDGDEPTRTAAKQVFATFGDAGAQALMRQLASARGFEERRVYFDALRIVGVSSAVIDDALAHGEWYVARNAAELAGELRLESSCAALGAALMHLDARVRESAALALSRFETPVAYAWMQAGIDDQSPAVRRHAARAYVALASAGLAAGASPAPGVPAYAPAQLIAAFERETDVEGQLEIVAALGVIATPDAVQRLLRVATSTAATIVTGVRLAALEALVRARGGAAKPMLRSLRGDREPAIRDAARRLEASIAA